MHLKSYIFLLLLFILPVISPAQYIIGVSHGYNVSGILMRQESDPEYKTRLSVERNSYLFSGFLKSRINGKVFNPGYAFEFYQSVLSGTQTEGDLTSGIDRRFDFTLQFLNIIFKPEFVFGTKWKFILNSGAFIGVIIHNPTTIKNATNQFGGSYEWKYNTSTFHYFNTLNAGILAGFGTEYPVSKNIILNAEANFTCGVLDLGTKNLTRNFISLFNTRISCGIAYKFNRSVPKESKTPIVRTWSAIGDRDSTYVWHMPDSIQPAAENSTYNSAASSEIYVLFNWGLDESLRFPVWFNGHYICTLKNHSRLKYVMHSAGQLLIERRTDDRHLRGPRLSLTVEPGKSYAIDISLPYPQALDPDKKFAYELIADPADFSAFLKNKFYGFDLLKERDFIITEEKNNPLIRR